MSFETHYEKLNRLRDAVPGALAQRIPTPKPGTLLTPEGRARWFERVRRAAVQVLNTTLDEAKTAGDEHGREVVDEWEGRS